jgi:hypothetical protein
MGQGKVKAVTFTYSIVGRAVAWRMHSAHRHVPVQRWCRWMTAPKLMCRPDIDPLEESTEKH